MDRMPSFSTVKRRYRPPADWSIRPAAGGKYFAAALQHGGRSNRGPLCRGRRLRLPPVLRGAAGSGQHPAALFFLALSMGINLVLDLGLAAGLSMGVAGAALATGLGWIGVVTFWTALVWKEIYKYESSGR